MIDLTIQLHLDLSYSLLHVHDVTFLVDFLSYIFLWELILITFLVINHHNIKLLSTNKLGQYLYDVATVGETGMELMMLVRCSEAAGKQVLASREMWRDSLGSEVVSTLTSLTRVRISQGG